MRLLQLGANGTLTITKYLLPHETSQYDYAILSHTWGPDEEEVTFQDIFEGTGLKKEGYKKILFCGQQAAADHLDYFWVDTCCIDKRNYTEYSEAINSMFRWYRDAKRCYVYMTDVLRDSRVEDHELTRSTWEPAFRNSLWFTRGWTLQELIAPSSVEFFSWDRRRLGDRESLEQDICDITRIPAPVFRRAALSEFSIEERISWSRHRQTTRPEDKAYSLLGILGIYMSPIYGEGEDEAFVRLRRSVSARAISTAALMDKLPVARGASFDSHAEEHNPVCLPDTRTDLLREVIEWTEDCNAKAIYWLNGMAGTGKSTISRTLAHTFARKGSLGATFFFKRIFKRDESDRGNDRGSDQGSDRDSVTKLFSTIASQLIIKAPKTAMHIQNTLDDDPGIVGKSMKEQLQRLIFDPLSKISNKNDCQNQTYVFIIDALDECKDEKDIKLLIKLLCESNMSQSPRLRIFLTSRPELPIRLGFNAIDGQFQYSVLHEIAEPIVNHDIAVFFKHELSEIKQRYNNSVLEKRKLPLSWPSQAKVDVLVQMAAPLFIFAASTCRFIGEQKIGNPNTQLEEVLQYQTKCQEIQLDTTYLPVLHYLVARLPRSKKAMVLDRFRQIVGSVIILSNPLTIPALAKMLNLSENVVSDHLDLLHSVFNVPSSSTEPIKLFHLSFRDFLFDPEKSDSPFWIGEKETHRQVKDHCLRLMSETLKADICCVSNPGTRVSAIEHSIIDDKLPSEVQYACRFWPYHLEQAGWQASDEDQIHNFLATHFLHWVEALSLIRRTSEAFQIMKTLQSLVPISSTRILSFLHDGLRFILALRNMIETTPLQIYSSGLLFEPEQSIIRSTFDNIIPQWLLSQPKAPNIWDPGLQMLESRETFVNLVTFSPNGKLVAAMEGYGDIRIWAIDTGDLLSLTPEGSRRGDVTIAFSPDGESLVSITEYDIQVWDVHTGQLIQRLEGNPSRGVSVALSFDCRSMASALEDGTIKIWTMTGRLLQTLHGHSNVIKLVAFSPDGKLIASVSEDNTARLWAADTGDLLWTTEFNANGCFWYFRKIVFSPDGKTLAWNLENLQLWSIEAGSPIRMFTDSCRFIDSLAFSPVDRLIALGFTDGTVQIRALETGDILQRFHGHINRVTSVAFSPDGTLIASGSPDGTVRIWAVDTDHQVLKKPESHNGPVRDLMFSPNGTLIASGSDDETVRIWAADTCGLLQTLDVRERIVSISFSPDNKLVASISKYGEVRLWDINTGDLLQKLKVDTKGALTVSSSLGRVLFSPDGTVVTSSDGMVVTSTKSRCDAENQHVVTDMGGCYGTSADNQWITIDGEELLWLPVDFRPNKRWDAGPDTFAVFGSVMAIGTASGRVFVLQLDESRLGMRATKSLADAPQTTGLTT